MKTYGFKSRSDAKTLKRFARFQHNRPDTVDQAGDYGGQPQPSQTVVPVRAIPGGRGIIAMTPAAGIAAMASGTPGKADCEIWTHDDVGDLADSGEEIEIQNVMSSAIGGDTLILASYRDGVLTVDAEDCPAAAGPTNP